MKQDTPDNIRARAAKVEQTVTQDLKEIRETVHRYTRIHRQYSTPSLVILVILLAVIGGSLIWSASSTTGSLNSILLSIGTSVIASIPSFIFLSWGWTKIDKILNELEDVTNRLAWIEEEYEKVRQLAISAVRSLDQGDQQGSLNQMEQSENLLQQANKSKAEVKRLIGAKQIEKRRAEK